MGITRGLESIHYPQLFPHYLLDIYAPSFFKRFTHGQIWFLERSFDAGSALDDHDTMIKAMLGDRPHHGPQAYGIGFEGVMESIALMLPMLIRYPHVHGRYVGSMGGFWFFIPDKPLSLLESFSPDFSDFLRYDTIGVYNDSLWSPGTLPRPQFEALRQDVFQKYLKWYMTNLNNLNGFLLNITDKDTRFLASFTLARICVDTYLIQLNMEQYLRKLLFLSLLDKYANLISQLGSKRKETEIWKGLLSFSMFESKIEPLLEKIPKEIGLAEFARNLLGELVNDVLYTMHGNISDPRAHEGEALDYLRTYRNSYHGYLLNNPNERTSFLNHSGDIPNHLPDYSISLWHLLLADPNGLISAF
jgi:hypothetical protein